jgi:hypothetical protein
LYQNQVPTDDDAVNASKEDTLDAEFESMPNSDD